jgi:4'-phosphopantetheinyl transferase EntD
MVAAAPMPVFAWELEHGLCVGVELPVEDDGLLLPAERALAAEKKGARLPAWVGGRVAMRVAAARLGIALPPVGSDDRGAPVLPAGVLGSISHKADLAVALLGRDADPRARLGVDVEEDRPGKLDISGKVLRDEELDALASLGEPERGREVLLRFSLKEAVYKALDPFVRRYVGFKEVAVTVSADGSAEVQPHLEAGEGPFVFTARWRREKGLVVTTVRVVAVARS